MSSRAEYVTRWAARTSDVLRTHESPVEMSPDAKYPTTPYWPWSPSIGRGDGIHIDPSRFVGEHVVVTEKLDGGNTVLLDAGRVYARSVAAPSEGKWMAMVMGERVAAVGLDLGGTNLRSLLLSESGDILARRIEALPRQASRGDLIEPPGRGDDTRPCSGHWREAGRRGGRNHGWQGPSPSFVYLPSGRPLPGLSNQPSLVGLDVAEHLGGRLGPAMRGVPRRIENDARGRRFVVKPHSALPAGATMPSASRWDRASAAAS